MYKAVLESKLVGILCIPYGLMVSLCLVLNFCLYYNVYSAKEKKGARSFVSRTSLVSLNFF